MCLDPSFQNLVCAFLLSFTYYYIYLLCSLFLTRFCLLFAVSACGSLAPVFVLLIPAKETDTRIKLASARAFGFLSQSASSYFFLFNYRLFIYFPFFYLRCMSACNFKGIKWKKIVFNLINKFVFWIKKDPFTQKLLKKPFIWDLHSFCRKKKHLKTAHFAGFHVFFLNSNLEAREAYAGLDM